MDDNDNDNENENENENEIEIDGIIFTTIERIEYDCSTCAFIINDYRCSCVECHSSDRHDSRHVAWVKKDG